MMNAGKHGPTQTYLDPKPLHAAMRSGNNGDTITRAQINKPLAGNLRRQPTEHQVDAPHASRQVRQR